MHIDFGNPFFTRMRQLYFRLWRPALLVAGLVAVAYLLYFRRLGILLPGFSQAEINTYTHSTHWHDIVANPLYAPYSVLVWLLAVLEHGHVQSLAPRAVSACFGIVAVVAFYAIIRPWYSFRIATLGTLLFATSAGLLHTARLGTPLILQMSSLAFAATALWYKREPRYRTLLGYAIVILSAALWYVPGMLWFEVLGCLLLAKVIWRQLQRTHRVHIAAWLALFLGILTPLVAAGARNPHILLTAFGLPGDIDALSQIASNLYNAVLSIGVRSDGNPLYWTGHLPLLNAAELALGALGAYYYARKRSVRAAYLTGALAVSIALIGLGAATFVIMLPLLYLFMVHGLDHLLGRWFAVFPRNPFARYIGVGAVCALLFFSILYQIRVYFVAWPHHTATSETFSRTLPASSDTMK